MASVNQFPLETTPLATVLASLNYALYKATSTTSLAIGTGTKVFTIQAGKDIAVGDFVLAVSDADETNYMLGQTVSYSDTTLTLTVPASNYTGGSGTYADWTLRLSGPPGATGKAAGYAYSWLTDTTSSDPTAGKVKANNATFASITEIYLSETDADANGIAAVIAAAVSGTSTNKCRFKLYDPVTPTNFMEFDATALTDNGDWDTIAVTPRSDGGSFSAALALRVDFYPKGDKGDTGATGAAGGGLANVVDDTTPQLGGQLDVNGQAIGDGTLELLKFEETASAINEVTIVNAAIGAGPTVKATGDDTNIDLLLVGKGTGKVKVDGNYPVGQGYHTVNLLAVGMVKRTTNGASAYSTEKATNDVMVAGYEFSASVEQAIQISYPTPKGMDGATALKCKFYATTATAGTGNVIWGIRGRYVRDDDAIDGAWGTAAETTDAFLADGDQHISAEVTFTPGGTFGSECMLYVEVYRKAADGADTYTQTMVLQAAMTKIPINAATDA